MSAFRNVKIISDGKPNNTQLVDAETGEKVPGAITKITWTAEPAKLARAVVEYANVPVEVIGEGVMKLDIDQILKIADEHRAAQDATDGT